ncbi:E3 ubiquitin-protein ligase rf298-like protein [Trifolium pratense]|uniref:E3 ubiquitin-protein ligase rf298-like protein n=2 Tax=Trifolium pratense TaxID=57577 RepID=A0A2K3PH68_TRIPR|nr:E3 ubiquitin-protein ligase rf298-like protein [Trifolium pratense]CAJ2658534.1 unnamed protein product [Trifolium pratense]
MASLVASGNSQMSSVQEKGSRNKRKFRADPPSGEPNKIISSPQHESLSYEFAAEKIEITPTFGRVTASDLCSVSHSHDCSDGLKLDLGLSSPVVSPEVRISHPKEELEVVESHGADWSDHTETQLEELVLSNLQTIFKSAIKKVVACGYTEDVATKAMLRPGVCYGCKDTVSNIVENTLAFLRNGQEFDPSREHYFENLVQLQKYILAELVCVLREVRPFFSVGDAMWCLLICDMNVSHACAMDGDPFSSLCNDGNGDGCSSVQTESQSKVETKSPELSLPSPCNTIPSVSQSEKSIVAENSQTVGGLLEKQGANSADKSSNASGTSHSPLLHEKCGSVRKVHPSSTKRDYIFRQKSIHVEKNYRTYGSKGSSRGGKLSGLSGLILDKKLKSVSESTTINLKSASINISKAVGINVTQDNLNTDLSSNDGPSTPTSFSLNSSGAISRASDPSSSEHEENPIPAVGIPPDALPATDTDLSLSLSSKSNSTTPICCGHKVPNSSCVGIPYDKSMGQWLPQDRKDELILKMVPRVRELQNELQEWTEWANQKVMQAARRLSKDKAELKTLKQEKEEVERLKKEKQCLEENTMKKLFEMENALGKAGGQVERANTAVRKLEMENAALRKEMEAAKLRAAESATNFQEASKREKKTQMKFQSWENQKSQLQEELNTEKSKLAQILKESKHAEMQAEKFEAKRRQAAKKTEELLLLASSIRKEREQIEETARAKEETIKLEAEMELQRYKDDIQKIEKEIAQIRQKSDSSKIAALKRGIDGSYAGSCKDMKNGSALEEPQTASISELVQKLNNFSMKGGGVKRERECVMCLSEEMSVVFLPCAHQVVCTKCNELHEKQGMQECPSCRSPIQERISVRYART